MYRAMIETLHSAAVDIASLDASESSTPRFLLHEPIAVVASPGRDRLMMGHVATPLTHATHSERGSKPACTSLSLLMHSV